MLSLPEDHFPERHPSFRLTNRLGRQLAGATGELAVRADLEELADDLDFRRRANQQQYLAQHTLTGIAMDDALLTAVEAVEARHPGYIGSLGMRRLAARAQAEEEMLDELIATFRTRRR